MDIARSNDHSLLSFYESVRRQVEADKRLGGRVRFVGDTAKQYAEQLREEAFDLTDHHPEGFADGIKNVHCVFSKSRCFAERHATNADVEHA